MLRGFGMWYRQAMVVKLDDLLAEMFAAMERKEREAALAEAGVSPDELDGIMAELAKQGIMPRE